jgi:hypothetical protein
MSVEFTIEGLNAKQRVLADIMWSLDGIQQVNAFIKSLPKQEQKECRSIIELMKMAVVEQCYDGIGELTEADALISKIKGK